MDGETKIGESHFCDRNSPINPRTSWRDRNNNRNGFCKSQHGFNSLGIGNDGNGPLLMTSRKEGGRIEYDGAEDAILATYSSSSSLSSLGRATSSSLSSPRVRLRVAIVSFWIKVWRGRRLMWQVKGVVR